ncbi:MAG TPA: SIMPL domain-containing protein [Desulfuromonadales bacterium]|nr:SIMPL domain-containing protein [Desulfuromonadales bacterium]
MTRRGVGAALMMAGILLGSCAAFADEQVSRLTVSGKAELTVPADQVQLVVTVRTTGKKVEEALEENSRRMRQVQESLLKSGLEEDEFRTDRFRIRPQWSLRPNSAPSDWQPQITGYTVRNSVKIKTQKIKLVGDVIESTIEAGANEVDSIRFALADPRSHRADAISEAVGIAQADARALAEASSVELVRLLELNLDNAAVAVPRPTVMAEARMASPDRAPPISPGDVPVRAQVTLSYEVAN